MFYPCFHLSPSSVLLGAPCRESEVSQRFRQQFHLLRSLLPCLVGGRNNQPVLRLLWCLGRIFEVMLRFQGQLRYQWRIL